MFTLIIAVIIIAVVIIFSVQNAVPVSITFLAWKFDASLAVIVFLVFAIGIVVTTLCSFAFRLKRAAQRRVQKAESQKTK